jgi:hypothetical protein
MHDVMLALLAKYAPEWKLTMPSTSSHDGAVELRGALPVTMHFGSMRVTLADGVAVFVDEDHRDGGDCEIRRVTLTSEELSRLSPR